MAATARIGEALPKRPVPFLIAHTDAVTGSVQSGWGGHQAFDHLL